MYLKERATIFEIMIWLSILSLSYFWYYLLYVVIDCCGLLILDPTLVEARHYFQPTARFGTYSVHVERVVYCDFLLEKSKRKVSN